MNTEWLKGLKQDEIQKRKDLILGNKIVLDILRDILYNMDKRSEVTVLDDYDTPSWSHKQAHLNGQRDMLRKIINIVDLDKGG